MKVAKQRFKDPVVKPPEFVFKPKYGTDMDRLIVTAAGDHNPLGEINERRGMWCVAYDSNLYEEFSNLEFNSKEETAAFLWITATEIERINRAKPLPDRLSRYLLDRASSVKDRIKALVSELRDLRREQYALGKFAEQYDVTRLVWSTDEGNSDLVCRELLEWTREGEATPFFSETVLYELIGKEDARTLLALTKNVIKHASPAYEIEL